MGDAMSRLMTLFGIVLAIAGALLVVLSVASPGIMQVYGATPEAGAILLVGGVLALGLGGVISAINSDGSEAVAPVMPPKRATLSSEAMAPVAGGSIQKGAEATTSTVDPAAASKSAVSVAETISALEQAKSDIKTALGGMDAVTGSSEKSTPDAEAAPAAMAGEDGDAELYVVEEKIIRGRPSRILSDDTVEAETDEGWMRFENLEHLNEYLDSVEESQA